MSYLVDATQDDIASGAAYAAYRRYLETVKNDLPPNVYEIATASWYYDFSQRKCPHDSWIELIEISYHAPRPERARISRITMKLLGAFHDRYLYFVYHDVVSYRIDMPPASAPNGVHGDWIIDEFSISERKAIIHEIKFWTGPDTAPKIAIECRNLEFREEIIEVPKQVGAKPTDNR